MIMIMSEEIQVVFDGGWVKALSAGETLFLSGDPVHSMCLVIEGQIDLVRHTNSGNRILLFEARVGEILAEASAYSQIYHCDGIAAVNSRVSSIPLATFLEKLDQHVLLARLWAAQLARGLQGARMSSAIKSMKSVGERLDAWLAGGTALPPKGHWQILAQSLGVSREALYRELAKRREQQTDADTPIGQASMDFHVNVKNS